MTPNDMKRNGKYWTMIWKAWFLDPSFEGTLDPREDETMTIGTLRFEAWRGFPKAFLETAWGKKNGKIAHHTSIG